MHFGLKLGEVCQVGVHLCVCLLHMIEVGISSFEPVHASLSHACDSAPAPWIKVHWVYMQVNMSVYVYIFVFSSCGLGLFWV